MTDTKNEGENFGNIEAINEERSREVKQQARDEIYNFRKHEEELNEIPQSARGEQVDCQAEVLKF